MNGKTSKLIRKVSTQTGLKERLLKRLWYSIPKKNRYEVRQQWETILRGRNG